jgi:hypothetical protein
MKGRGRSGGNKEKLREDTARSEGLIVQSGMVDIESPLGDPRNLKELRRRLEKCRDIWDERYKEIRCERHRGLRTADILGFL